MIADFAEYFDDFVTDVLNTLTYLFLTLLGIEWHKETTP